MSDSIIYIEELDEKQVFELMYSPKKEVYEYYFKYYLKYLTEDYLDERINLLNLIGSKNSIEMAHNIRVLKYIIKAKEKIDQISFLSFVKKIDTLPGDSYSKKADLIIDLLKKFSFKEVEYWLYYKNSIIKHEDAIEIYNNCKNIIDYLYPDNMKINLFSPMIKLYKGDIELYKLYNNILYINKIGPYFVSPEEYVKKMKEFLNSEKDILSKVCVPLKYKNDIKPEHIFEYIEWAEANKSLIIYGDLFRVKDWKPVITNWPRILFCDVG